MSTSIQLHIDDPCHENWNKMTPHEQGRFCMSCQKTVTDFSLMSDKEILDYLLRAGSNTCGRFTNDQLGRDIEEIKQPKMVLGLCVEPGSGHFFNDRHCQSAGIDICSQKRTGNM